MLLHHGSYSYPLENNLELLYSFLYMKMELLMLVAIGIILWGRWVTYSKRIQALRQKPYGSLHRLCMGTYTDSYHKNS